MYSLCYLLTTTPNIWLTYRMGQKLNIVNYKFKLSRNSNYKISIIMILILINIVKIDHIILIYETYIYNIIIFLFYLFRFINIINIFYNLVINYLNLNFIIILLFFQYYSNSHHY